MSEVASGWIKRNCWHFRVAALVLFEINVSLRKVKEVKSGGSSRVEKSCSSSSHSHHLKAQDLVEKLHRFPKKFSFNNTA